MKTIYQEKFGDSSVLIYGEQPIPSINDSQVLIAVHATSINPRDWLIRSGKYQLQFLVPRFPLILGSDFSGTVVKVGKSVRNFKEGDQVYGMNNPTQGLGAHAEFVSADESVIALKPNSMNFNQAAGVPLCGLTAWQALHKLAGINKDHKILIVGATGGVGSFAVQLAKAAGANVTVICGAKSEALAKELGANEVLDYAVNPILDRNAFDIVFDTVGRKPYSHYLPALKNTGNFISTIPNPANLFASVVSWLVKPLRLKPSIQVVMVKPNSDDLNGLTSLIDAGKVSTLIDTVYALKNAKLAHDKSRSFRAKGKLILEVKA